MRVFAFISPWNPRCYSQGMIGARFWLGWLTSVALAYGAVVTPPRLGFAQNVGQYDSDVLFGLGDQLFYRNKVQLTWALSVRFANANQSTTAVGVNPLAFPLNLYLGSDPTQWREHVPHYATVRYAQIYPGIDAEWNSGPGNSMTDPPMLRIHVAPGANPQHLLLRLDIFGNLDWTVSGNWVRAGGISFGYLAAYQTVGAARSQVAASFVKVDGSSFRPEVGAYDPALPLVIQFGAAPYAYLSVGAVKPGYDDTALLAGEARFSPSPGTQAFLAAVSPDGSPVFLSLFQGMFQEAGPIWLAASRNGDTTIARTVCAYPEPVPLPATPGAPRAVSRPGHLDGWVGRFDRSGRLRAATFTGDALGALAVDAEGTVYFATGESVVRWVPGAAQFSFVAPVRSVSSLSANSSGGLAFAAAGSEGQPTTAGAYKRRYEGPWDLYVGVLDQLSGSIRMATYVPIAGRTTGPFTSRSSVALAPGGHLWVGSAFRFQDDRVAAAFTLVAVSADGAKELRSESVPAFPYVAFDSRGQVWVAVSTSWPNLLTALDAPRRAACHPNDNLYLRTLSPEGAVLDATYLPVSGRILAFDGPDRLFVSELGGPVDIGRPVRPGIGCVIHTASRQASNLLAPGGLSTLVGNRLGPLEQSNATLDGSGRLPLTLAGVQVLINGISAALVSVQQGLITFYTPEEMPPGSAQVEVRVAGASVASTSLSIYAALAFAILTADGSGRGLAAALNQDGTVNGPNNPAKSGSVVAVFGTGPLPASILVIIGSITSLQGSGTLAKVEYAGPAPGAVPGVKQVNFRLPDLGPGPVYVWIQPGLYTPGGPIIYVTP